MIFPICLYGFELQEASKILYEMKKSFKKKKEKGEAPMQERGIKSITKEDEKLNYKNEKLDVEDITNNLIKPDGTIDEKKLEDLVEETVENSPLIKLFRYKHSNFPHQRLMILDIIKDKLTMMLVENNKPTFKVFKAISGRNWGELCQSVQNTDKIEDYLHFNLELNEMVFKKRLRELGFQPPIQHELDKKLELIPEIITPPPQRSSRHRFSDKIMPQSLIIIVSKIKDFKNLDFTMVNIPLLREALLAFFKAKYNVAVPFTTINFKCFIAENKAGFVANLKKFLKLNLTELAFNNKNFVGFGMKYKIQNDTVYFYGRPYREFEGNTIVFQIVSKNGKILREVNIRGIEDDKDEERGLIVSSDDILEDKRYKNKGQEVKFQGENFYQVIKSDFDHSQNDEVKIKNPEMKINLDMEEVQNDDAKNIIIKD